jgi:cell division protein FtsX
MDKKSTYVRLEFVDHWSSNTDLPDDIVLEASSPNAAEEFVQAITELRHKDDVILKQTDLNEILRQVHGTETATFFVCTRPR